MAVPYGFKSWQEYLNKHIAQWGDCADYYQGDGTILDAGPSKGSPRPTRSGRPSRSCQQSPR
jgi:hypothetical protein